jgi:hypothetical protein
MQPAHRVVASAWQFTHLESDTDAIIGNDVHLMMRKDIGVAHPLVDGVAQHGAKNHGLA